MQLRLYLHKCLDLHDLQLTFQRFSCPDSREIVKCEVLSSLLFPWWMFLSLPKFPAPFFFFLAITKLREGESRGKAQLGDLSLPLAAGRPWFWHWRAGLGEAARLLLVARPHRVLVDDGTEQSCRGNQMGHVVWRRKILSGECSGPTVILLSGDIFFPFFFQEKPS